MVTLRFCLLQGCGLAEMQNLVAAVLKSHPFVPSPEPLRSLVWFAPRC